MRRIDSIPTPTLTVALALLTAALLSLGGCDVLSLFDLFDRENPGAFSISPSEAVLQTDQTVTLKVRGGFGSYSYDYYPAPLQGTFDELTGFYKAPAVVPDQSEEIIGVTDELGNRTTAVLTVYSAVAAPLAVDPTAWTATAGDSRDFTISGGRAPYAAALDGTPLAVAVNTVTVNTSGLAEGEHSLEITDAMQTLVMAAITVISPQTLGIDPKEVTVGSGQTVDFTAINAVAPVFSVDPPGTGTFVTATRYQAPVVAYPATTTEIIRLTDGARSVTATVHVVNADPLVITPSYSAVLVGETVALTASGSVPGAVYIFTLAGGKGTVEKTGPNTALYTAPPTLPTRDQVCLTDDVGSLPVYAVVKVSKPK